MTKNAMLELTCEASYAASTERLWAFLTDNANLPTFIGFGPIPGIVGARWLTQGEIRLGAVREIRNTDGSTHREEVVTFEPGRAYEDRIDEFSSPLRWLVRQCSDRFEFEKTGSGAKLRRSFRIELRSPLLMPVALVLRGFMRKAIDRHHLRIGEVLSHPPSA